MTQLSLLDEQLQAELARAPHWAEPRSKARTSAWPLRVDYRAWLEHVAGCEEYGLARDALVDLRAGRLESEPATPRPVGIRLHMAAVGQLIDHARDLDGRVRRHA